MRAILALWLSVCAGFAWANGFTTLKGHGGPIMDLAVGSDGVVVSASFDNALGVWSENGGPTWLEGHEAAVNTLAFGPDGRILSGGDDFSVRVWSGIASDMLYRHQGKVVDLATSDRQLASASWDGAIGVWRWDRAAEPKMLKGHRAGVNAVAFSDDGRRLFSASADGGIRVWDPWSGEELRQLVKHGFGVNEMILNESEGWLAYGAVDGGTRVLAPDTGEEIADFTLDRRPILAMAHHEPSGQLAVGDGQGYIMIVDTHAWRIVRDFRATRKGPVWALAFSADGETIYAGGLDDVVYGWPVALLDTFEPGMGEPRSFLRNADAMPNGERQFMRKCSICHALTDEPSRKAGPTLFGLFGRPAGAVAGYSYSPILSGSDIVWDDDTIDALFDQGPDHYIPGSKMPMQVIAGPNDRADLIEYLRIATRKE